MDLARTRRRSQERTITKLHPLRAVVTMIARSDAEDVTLGEIFSLCHRLYRHDKVITMEWTRQHLPTTTLPPTPTTQSPLAVIEYSTEGERPPGAPPNEALAAALTYPINEADFDANTRTAIGSAIIRFCADPANMPVLRDAALSDPVDVDTLTKAAAQAGTTVSAVICHRVYRIKDLDPIRHR